MDVREIIDKIGPAGSNCWYAVNSGLDADKHLHEALVYIKQKGELVEVASKELERWQRLIQPITDKILDGVESRGLPARRFYSRMIELVAEYSQPLISSGMP